MKLNYTKKDELGNKTRLSWKQGVHSMTHLKNGDKYIGEWKDDKMHGKGIYYYTRTNNVYEGQFEFDEPSGFGVYSVPIFKVKKPKTQDIFEEDKADTQKKNFDPLPPNKLKKLYVGEWEIGLKNGYGTFYYDNGSVYEGQWKDNVRQGWGKMTYDTRMIYEGEWHADKRHGQGVLVHENGDRYEGTFMRDKKEGPGRFIYLKKRQMYEGEWLDDIAKCGTLVQFPNSKPEHPFPVVELVDYKKVLNDSFANLQSERESRVINV